MSVALFALLAAAQAVTTLDDDVNRPVAKVINLLKDMRVQLEKEGEEDEETYQKVKCWCTVNDKDKTTSIADAESRIMTLTATIEEKTAASARLTTEIKNLDNEVAKNQEALAKATEMRRKELAEFNAEEKDAIQSIGALKQAVTVLGKHHESLMQMPQEALLNLVSMVEDQLTKEKNKKTVDAIMTPTQKAALKALLQSPSDFFTNPTYKQGYAPQSGAIFGILKQMKETFETNLELSQKDEMAAIKTFEELKAAKSTEIESGQQQSDTKSQELADADSKMAQAKEDKEDTEKSLAADIEYLANLKETCKMTDSEYAERTKTRAEEVQAVSEALSILSSDEAHNTFRKTFNFLQVSSVPRWTADEHFGRVPRQEEAAKVLFKAAKATGSPKLAALAVGTRLDAFKKVQESINGMVAELKKQKQDEINHRDSCIKELNDNAAAQEHKARDIEDLHAKINDLTQSIEELTKNIATLKAEVADMETALLHAGQDREVENNDFQLTVADQRATQRLVTGALNALNAFYAKKDKGATLVQTSQPGPPPPPGFKTYKKQNGGGVVGMLKDVIAEAEMLEKDAIQAETDAQKAYEKFVKDSNESIGQKNRDITDKAALKAEQEEDRTAAEEDLAAANNEQEQNGNTNADLHKACDFTLNNFEARQTANAQEQVALKEAMAILSGSGMKLFLQRK